MKDEIVVLIKPGNMKRLIESFGNNRFLCRVIGKTEQEINAEVVEMLAKYTGHPPQKIVLKSNMNKDTKLFQLI